MVDYNPRYEYKEEKGVSGLLFLYLILLVGADLFLFIFSIAAAQTYYKSIEGLRIASLIIGLAFILFIIFQIIALYKIPKIAVKVGKTYLIARVVYLLPITIINFVTSLNDPNFNRSDASSAIGVQNTIYVLVIQLLYLLSFSILWYIYFLRSKRIKEYYIDLK